MSTTCKNLSQVKLNIKQIVDNLQQLKSYEGHENDLEKLKTDTKNILSKLENLPLEELKSKIKKRQRKRIIKNFQKPKNPGGKTSQERNDVEEASGLTTLKMLREPKRKFEQHFNKSIKECKRFLQTFELLEQLHLLRGDNSSETYKFALKLRQMKSIWNCLLQDKQLEQTSTDVIIQQQWNEVLFGPPEKSFFRDKPDIHDFIGKRQVWDSYIDRKYGYSIPIGWILPPMEINEKWRPYILQTNI